MYCSSDAAVDPLMGKDKPRMKMSKLQVQQFLEHDSHLALVAELWQLWQLLTRLQPGQSQADPGLTLDQVLAIVQTPPWVLSCLDMMARQPGVSSHVVRAARELQAGR